MTFQEALTVFGDERGLLLDDPDHSASEERFVLLGRSSTLNTLVVAHCYREARDSIRIVSARKASRPERASYEDRWRP